MIKASLPGIAVFFNKEPMGCDAQLTGMLSGTGKFPREMYGGELSSGGMFGGNWEENVHPCASPCM